MWLAALKVFLVVLIIFGMAMIMFVGVRRSRANRGDPNWGHRNTRPSQNAPRLRFLA